MTEAEWLVCEDSARMLEFIRNRASDRKLRLLACACYRRLWDNLASEADKEAIEVAERFADGKISKRRLGIAFANAYGNYLTAVSGERHFAYPVAEEFAPGCPSVVISMRAEHPNQVGLFRDTFGPLLFRPVTFDPAWRTATVTSLAHAIYDDRAFDRMPILADALEDVGCTNAEVLGHCRGGGEHVRGCWVVDLVLGKE